VENRSSFFSSFLKGQGPIQKERDDGTTQSDVHFANIKLRVKIKIKKLHPNITHPRTGTEKFENNKQMGNVILIISTKWVQ